MDQLQFENFDFEKSSVSPFLELGAYEAIWDTTKATFKRVAEQFATVPFALPSDFIPTALAQQYANQVHSMILDSGVSEYGVRIHGAGEYPERLRDAEYPVELLYYQGWWELVSSPRSIAVVGTRNPSKDGEARTRNIVRKLLEDNFTIVSGLAKGVDTVAHETALSEGGNTIAVLGTPLTRAYPAINNMLQNEISKNHLVVSQVPVAKYENVKSPTHNNFFFPERNKTMSALTDATVIIEAGETSGTLVQARAALKQGRKLFILENCFRNPNLTWPSRFEKLGAIRVRDYSDIRSVLVPQTVH